MIWNRSTMASYARISAPTAAAYARVCSTRVPTAVESNRNEDNEYVVVITRAQNGDNAIGKVGFWVFPLEKES